MPYLVVQKHLTINYIVIVNTSHNKYSLLHVSLNSHCKLCHYRIVFSLGVALLGGNSDMNEASSLTFKNDIVDVYSNSWGPFDSGDIVEGPEELTRLALQSGANNVRILQNH